MQWKHIDYNKLTAKQKEIYNFQKVAALLADYGFNCVKLDDDWQGADFLAYHKDGSTTLNVQLKGRATICKKYEGKGLHVAFPARGRGEWYLLLHDDLVRIAGETTNWLRTKSWKRDDGQYHSANPPEPMLERLAAHVLKPLPRDGESVNGTPAS